MANKVKEIKKEEKLDEHHQAEKDKILSDHHKKERRNVKITLLFLFACVIAAVVFLSASGILDKNAGEAAERADMICFLSGYPGGLDSNNLDRNGTAYVFKCDTENITISYDRIINEGLIKWNK